jgi:hypothetical protein
MCKNDDTPWPETRQCDAGDSFLIADAGTKLAPPSSPVFLTGIFALGAESVDIKWKRIENADGSHIQCTTALAANPMTWEAFRKAALDFPRHAPSSFDGLHVPAESISTANGATVDFVHQFDVYLGPLKIGMLDDRVRMAVTNENGLFKIKITVLQKGNSKIGSIDYAICILDASGRMTLEFQITLSDYAAGLPTEMVAGVVNDNVIKYAKNIKTYFET